MLSPMTTNVAGINCTIGLRNTNYKKNTGMKLT